MKKFDQTIQIYPGWDRRNQDGGIHGCEIVFILRGSAGVITAAYFTDWMPKSVQDEYLVSGRRTNVIGVQPVPMDMSCHSPVPHLSPLPGDRQGTDCPYLPGMCHSRIIKGNAAANMRDTMLAEGTEGVWRIMAQHYRSEFSILLNSREV